MANTQQGFHYSRPLKATLTFSPSVPTPSPDFESTSSGVYVNKKMDGRDKICGNCDEVECEYKGQLSSSLGSLNDTDAEFMAWSQVDRQEEHSMSHRRSSSFSITNKTAQSHGEQQVAPVRYEGQVDVQWRCSAEGLNQEVSAVLEGKTLLCVEPHPDGHRAPVNELLSGRIQSHQSSTSLPSSPSMPHPDYILSPLHRESPLTVEHSSSWSTGTTTTNSPSPSCLFDREPQPPDGAERCVIVQEAVNYTEGNIPRGPDKSKANIVFRGSAFAPLLPTHSLKTMVIT